MEIALKVFANNLYGNYTLNLVFAKHTLEMHVLTLIALKNPALK